MTVLELQDRMALKDLVDRYAVESDKNNQDYYREIFTPDIQLFCRSAFSLNVIMKKIIISAWACCSW